MGGRGWFCVMARWKECLHLLDIQLSGVSGAALRTTRRHTSKALTHVNFSHAICCSTLAQDDGTNTF
jgi:hypothetical protein